jgi:hypothetical protein
MNAYEETRDPLDALMPLVVPPLLRRSGNGTVRLVELRDALNVYPEGRDRLRGHAVDVEHWLRARRWTPGTDRHGRRVYVAPTRPVLAFVNVERCDRDGSVVTVPPAAA